MWRLFCRLVEQSYNLFKTFGNQGALRQVWINKFLMNLAPQGIGNKNVWYLMFEYNSKLQCIFHPSSEIRNKSSCPFQMRHPTGKREKLSILSSHASPKSLERTQPFSWWLRLPLPFLEGLEAVEHDMSLPSLNVLKRWQIYFCTDVPMMHHIELLTFSPKDY